MSKAPLICLCIFLSLLGGIAGLTSFSSEAQAQGSGIIVEDAEYVSTNTTAYSADLVDVARNVTPRIIIEYGDSLSRLSLGKSDDLNQVASMVSPRIIVEYAKFIFECGLRSVTVPDISPRIIIEYANSIFELGLQGSQKLLEVANTVKPRIIVEYADSVFSCELERPMFELAVVAGVEKSFVESTLVETILGQNAVLNDVEVSGDLNGTLDFNSFEIVNITTGSFAGKGFSKGKWEATLEGLSYSGDWMGALFSKPSERKVYLKGAVSGEISGIVEGCLTETLPGSGIYDRYQATWNIGRLGVKTVSATILLNGTISYLSVSEFPITELYFLQTSIEGTVSGSYNGSLSIVLTHMRVLSDIPYKSEGFSIISYVSDAGIGEGWTYNKLTTPTTTSLEGLFANPLSGIISATLNESKTPRTLNIRIKRVDLGLPPAADLKVRMYGFERVSPGQTVTYTVELQNNGLKSAENISLAIYLPHVMKYSSSSDNGLYIARSNKVIWYLKYMPPKVLKLFTITGVVEWGLPAGAVIQPIVSVCEKEVEVRPDLTVIITDIVLNVTNNYLKMTSNVSNQSMSENLDIELHIASVDEGIDPVFRYTEQNGETRIYFEYTIEGGSWKKVSGIIRGTKNAYDMYKTYKDFRDIQTDLLKTEYFLEWLWINNYISQEQYEHFSKWYEGKSFFEFAGPNVLKKIPVFGSYYSETTKAIMDGMNPIFKRKLLEAMYLHALEGGSFTENCLEEVFEKYLKETSYGVTSVQSRITVARDPNIKYGPERYVSQGQTLNYTIEFENEGEGIAFGVYITETLDEDVDDSTLQIGPVINKSNGSIIAETGTYNPATRTITWLVSEVGPGEGGFANFSVKVRSDAPEGTEIINFATVYFPSVPETTRTNSIVSIVGQPDIAIIDIVPSQNVIEIGLTACVNITVANRGYLPETFNLTLYANATVIKTKNVFLKPRSNDTLIFVWNTTDFAIGNYIIIAQAHPITGETNISDNILEFSPVQVIQEFPSSMMLMLFLSATLITTIMLKRKKKTII